MWLGKDNTQESVKLRQKKEEDDDEVCFLFGARKKNVRLFVRSLVSSHTHTHRTQVARDKSRASSSGGNNRRRPDLPNCVAHTKVN